jgi:pSer/pThr/pTyr-binding forkhead associated (FHA) protein
MEFKLLVVRGQPSGKYLIFPPGEYMIGRGNECHIRPNSDWVSRQHCLLRITRSTAVIRDLGSTNGTLINGARVLGERKLVDGDQVSVGPLVFEARLEESIIVSNLAPTVLPAEPGTESKPTEPTDELPSYKDDIAVALHPPGRNGYHSAIPVNPDPSASGERGALAP